MPVTWALLGVLVAFTVATASAGGGPEVLLRFGALRGDLVWERGEWWRLGTAPWLHAGLIHLFFNGSALLQLGALVERLHGGHRMLAAYLGSAWTGALASAWGTAGGPVASVGASGAILGLAGLLLVQRWTATPQVRRRLAELLGDRLLVSVGLTLALGLGLALVVPVVDNLAHLGGLLGGAAFGLLWRRPVRAARSPLAVAGVLAALVSGGFAVGRGRRAVATLDEDVGRALLRGVAEAPEGVAAGIRLAEAARRLGASGADPGAALAPVLRGIRDVTTLSLAASVLYEGGDDGGDDAVALGLVLDRWVEVAPGDAVALNALAWNLLHREPPDPRRADALADEALVGADADDAAMMAQICDTAAEARRQLGRMAEARDLQRLAVAKAREGAPDLLPVLLPRLMWLDLAAAAGP